MPTRRKTKTERFQVRIDDDAKRMLERAAALANTSVSAFVVSSALDAAGRLIREWERLVVSERDWVVFLDAIVNPPEPGEALRDAFAAHGRLITRTIDA